MNRSTTSLLAVLTILFLSACSEKTDPTLVTNFEILLDSSERYEAEELLDVPFETSNIAVPNLGVAEDPIWIRIPIEASQSERVLEIQSPNIDSLSFFRFIGDDLLEEYHIGEAFPFDQRPVKSPNFVFSLEPSSTEMTVMLRIVSGKQVLLPMYIDSPEEVRERQNYKDIFFGIYAGIILVMFLYNIFIWFSVRDRSYLYYVFFILFVGLTQLTLNGYGNQFFWPTNSWVALRSSHFMGVLSGVFTVIFAQHYLRIKRHSPWLNLVLNGYLGIYLIALILAIIGQFALSYGTINFCALASLLLVFAAIRSYRQGYRPALFFLIAWSIFLVGVTVYVLRDYGVLPYNLITQYALPIGSALEIVLLSFAIADRINQLKAEKAKEQEEKLKALKENERIITEQNTLLETKVKERTLELANSNKELNQAIDNLRSAQAQLVDAEKMASLGQLTAGIAHELNNPINFVSSNINPLERDLKELFEVLESYGAIPAEEVQSDQLKDAQALAQKYDIDFLKNEVQQLLKGIADGAARTAEIVKGLRIFSRLDEDSLKKADVNECLRSTLIILKSNIKTESKVYDKLDPDLPQINCYPGKLNQVFMNILVNAMQATAASGKPYDQRRVEVSTRFDDENLYVHIEDNGTGMPPEVKNRIFEPFYTTKEVGQGTGLGLSIVLGIINDHKGSIEVQSSPNEGTEFILTLSRTL